MTENIADVRGGRRTRNDLLLRRLHAHWITYFDYVLREGSIRKAANTLNVAPSSISRALKEIEDLLQEPLFEKVPSGQRLTAAGEVVAMHAKATMKGLSRMEDQLNGLRGLRQGHVRIASIQAASDGLLADTIAEFRRRHSNITMECAVSGSDDIARRIISGDSDIGIAFNTPKVPSLRELASAPLPFGAIMHPHHALANHGPLKLYDLYETGADLILPDEATSTLQILDSLTAGTPIQLQPTITARCPKLIVSLVQKGAGIAFQTPLGIERELREGSLVFVPLIDKKLKPPVLSVVTAASRAPSNSVLLLTDSLRTRVANLLACFT